MQHMTDINTRITSNYSSKVAGDLSAHMLTSIQTILKVIPLNLYSNSIYSLSLVSTLKVNTNHHITGEQLCKF